jgi:hypothetical protein
MATDSISTRDHGCDPQLRITSFGFGHGSAFCQLAKPGMPAHSDLGSAVAQILATLADVGAPCRPRR